MNEIPRTDEMGRLVQGVRDALSDSMVERITGTAGNALEVVDKLNEPDVKEGLLSLLDAVGTLHRTGALQTLIDAMFMIHALRSAATDSMVDRAFAFIEHMANNLGTEDLATLAHEAKGALEDAIDSCNIPGSASGGLIGTMRMLSQKETQEALRFMLSFSCSLKKRSMVLGKSPQG
ncbi:conserved hypothetical protein [Candidatus Terasakiella magnetica]|nr:conserved hypothetical protein [Candidatus Terasakiella magnetica]